MHGKSSSGAFLLWVAGAGPGQVCPCLRLSVRRLLVANEHLSVVQLCLSTCMGCLDNLPKHVSVPQHSMLGTISVRVSESDMETRLRR